jgi:hypothetical protein
LRFEALWLENPRAEVLRRIAQQAGDEDTPTHERQRRADQSIRARDAGYRMTGSAAFLGDKVGPVRGRSRCQWSNAFLRQGHRTEHREEQAAHCPWD